MLSSIAGGKALRRNMAIRKRWVKVASVILGLRAEIDGNISSGVYLFASNHRSFADPVVALQFIYALPLAKAEVGKYPLIGYGAKITGILFVQRESLKSRMSAREAIHESLRSELSVLIYPEGTTTDQQTAHPFKGGSFEVAAELGIPVIPVAIEYEDPGDHWSNTSLLSHYLRQFGKYRSRCKIGFGEPIYAGDAKQLRLDTQKWIDEKMQIYRLHFDESNGF